MSRMNNENEQSEVRHWKPRQGHGISGTLIRVMKVLVNGKKVRAAILKDEDGEQWSILLGYAVLESLWYEKNPRTGQVVTIEVTGYRESKKHGAEYLIFDLQAEDPKPEAKKEVASPTGPT